MCQFRIILLLVTSFVVIEGQFEDLTTVTQIADQILIKQTGLDCALYLNANGVVGCQGKSAGVLQAVKDLSSFVETECIAVVAADYFLEFIGQYKLHYKLQRYVKGILVDVRDNPERFSPAAKFPLSNYAPYSNVTYAWNPYGADILNSQFDIPVFLMLDDQSAKVQQRAAVNAIWGYKGVSHIGELDSESLAREDKNAKQCIYNQNCYPLGGYSVVAQYPPYTASEKDTILVIAQMDARAMFRGIMMGAESAASGLVALLTVVQLISQQSLTLAQQYNKQLVFAVLAGEPFDYMGTKSLQWQIQQGLISGLTFDKISAILEFNMLGSKNSSSLYVHGNDNSMLNQFVTISSDVKNGGGPGVPPSSIMSWMLLNSSYPAIVLSDFNLQFETTYYRSFADYITDMERDINVNLTADGAIAGARFLHALAGGQQELSIDRDTVHSIVSNLYTCLQTVNPGLSCPIAQQLMSYSLQGAKSTVGQLKSITKNPQNQDLNAKRNIERFVYNFVANRTGIKLEEEQRCDPTSNDNFCADGSVCVGWRYGRNISPEEGRGYCVNASVQFIPAWSPKFVCPQCEGTSTINQYNWQLVNESVSQQIDTFFSQSGIPLDAMWTQAIGKTFINSGQFEVYIKEGNQKQVIVLIGGIIATLGSGVIVMLLIFSFEKYVKSQ
eukprot:TRINITY_DN787_c0_g1_i2.p1 TRINITY_DN787_c0_g1~~TRINITY_DN787_c0_g1_i2.p1  ORF type:complete len:669 (+),score=79.44 TRINITY_DN787_c0_g1_i2:55-2061(+)